MTQAHELPTITIITITCNAVLPASARTEVYYQGDVIELHVAITAAHKGRFSFRICNSTTATTEECFNQNILLR